MTFLFADKKMRRRERVTAYAPATTTLISGEGHSQYTSVSLFVLHLCPLGLYFVSYSTVTTKLFPDNITTFLANAELAQDGDRRSPAKAATRLHNTVLPLYYLPYRHSQDSDRLIS